MMIAKCKAIAHGDTAINYIFREGEIAHVVDYDNLCYADPKSVYEEMKMVAGSNTC